MGPAVFPGSPPTHKYNWSFLECAVLGRSSQYGTRGFLGLTANPQHIFGPSWSVRHLGRSSQCGTHGFLGFTANPQHIFGPSCSVRLLAAPRNVGPTVFLGSPRQAATHIWSLLERAAPALLAVWDPRFSWAHRQPSTQFGPSWSVRLLAAPHSVGPAVFLGSPPTLNAIWSLLECAAPGRSSQCGTRGFLGFTANPQHIFGPSWSVRLLAAPRSVGPAVFLSMQVNHSVV